MPKRTTPKSETPIAARRTRYKPDVTASGYVLFSAEERRRSDAELLCERLSQRFIDTIRVMDDDQLVVLELIAAGIDHHHDFLPDLFGEGTNPRRVIDAARRFAAKREQARKGGAR